MSEKEIYAKIVEIIQEHDSSKLHVTPELNLKEELGVDSVDLMEFIINLEEAFDIEILMRIWIISKQFLMWWLISTKN